MDGLARPHGHLRLAALHGHLLDGLGLLLCLLACTGIQRHRLYSLGGRQLRSWHQYLAIIHGLVDRRVVVDDVHVVDIIDGDVVLHDHVLLHQSARRNGIAAGAAA